MSRMIDLDKLIQELKNRFPNYKTLEELILVKSAIDIVESFTVEPKIDFDALYNEWCKNTKDWSELRSPYDQARSLRDFLKSKNLTQPQVDMDALRNEIYASIQKPSEILVKKTWTLKKEYHEYHLKMCIGTMVDIKVDEEPQYPQYYDLHEEPDYSQVKVGDVVEIHHSLSNKPNYGIVQKNSNNILSITGNINSINAFCINYSHIKSLTILKAAE